MTGGVGSVAGNMNHSNGGHRLSDIWPWFFASAAKVILIVCLLECRESVKEKERRKETEKTEKI